jgi:hypothetical protein
MLYRFTGFAYCYLTNVLISTEGFGCKRGYLPHGIARVKGETYAFFLIVKDCVG